MRSYHVDSGAGLGGLALREEPEPTPGPGQVVIAVRAASLSFRELLILRGAHVLPVKPDVIPVSDGAGEVVAIGEGVARVRRAVSPRACLRKSRHREVTMAARKGRAEWDGDLQTGAGLLTVGEDAWTEQYSLRSRFEDASGTNAEELIAAAHASCFTMALVHVMGQEGYEPRSVRTAARVYLRNVDGLPTIARIDLETEGDVPGMEAPVFADYAERAKAGCAVSRALAGVREINVKAQFVG
jgi:osmotically inducible protein OsmC